MSRDADRWQGWVQVPAPAPPGGAGPWRELSHPLHEGFPRPPGFPAPAYERVRRQPEDPFNLTRIQMVCHLGTHLDAPCHFIPDGPAFHEIPLERLYGEGVVWHLPCQPHEVIGPERLAAGRPAPRRGDIVILSTGWAAHLGTERYYQHPSLSDAAADWLVAHGIKLLAIDFSAPDLPAPSRPAGFAFPVHHRLLSHGVLICEHVTNVAPLAGQRVEAMFLGLNVKGADGAPVRAVARPLA